MKTGTYASYLPGERKDNFTTAKELGLDGLILDYDNYELNQLPRRNYYVLQSLKTQLSIPAFILNAFVSTPMFIPEHIVSAKNMLEEALVIAEKMHVDVVLIPFLGKSQLNNENERLLAIDLINYACAFGQLHNVKIGIGEGISQDDFDVIEGQLTSDNYVYYVSNGFDGWSLIDRPEELISEH